MPIGFINEVIEMSPALSSHGCSYLITFGQQNVDHRWECVIIIPEEG